MLNHHSCYYHYYDDNHDDNEETIDCLLSRFVSFVWQIIKNILEKINYLVVRPISTIIMLSPNNNNNDSNYIHKQSKEQEVSLSFTSVGNHSFDNNNDSSDNSSDNINDYDYAVEILTQKLLAVTNDDSDEEDRIIRQSFRLSRRGSLGSTYSDNNDTTTDSNIENNEENIDTNVNNKNDIMKLSPLSIRFLNNKSKLNNKSIRYHHIFDNIDISNHMKYIQIQQITCSMLTITIYSILLLCIALSTSYAMIGPPSIPVGPYTLIERHVGETFFNYYTFYEGPDSMGSNGYLQYVNKEHAIRKNMISIIYENDSLLMKQQQQQNITNHTNTKYYNTTTTTTTDNSTTIQNDDNNNNNNDNYHNNEDEDKRVPFVYIGSSPTSNGPRDSIRLEGNRFFNRGLFIIDIRHMPTGCGVWPAFWMTDENNWPVNGEIDIIEGINYQTSAKTALHTTKSCTMNDVPIGTMTGYWDTVSYVPDPNKNYKPDSIIRNVQNCYVAAEHQWFNQGCVTVTQTNDTLGKPLNDNNGGIFVLEWDPINHHIRTWVFTPHTTIPDNLRQSIESANRDHDNDNQHHPVIVPDPDQWTLPYGYFTIGDGTECSRDHFGRMRLVLNTAFCGSAAGERYKIDCPKHITKLYKTCQHYIKSNPKELDDAYWKIRGVYIYQREWKKTWLY